jgi:hypothetical protein
MMGEGRTLHANPILIVFHYVDANEGCLIGVGVLRGKRGMFWSSAFQIHGCVPTTTAKRLRSALNSSSFADCRAITRSCGEAPQSVRLALTISLDAGVLKRKHLVKERPSATSFSTS